MLLNILVAWCLSAIAELGNCGFILYCSHVYKAVSPHRYKIALINLVYHTTLHYSTDAFQNSLVYFSISDKINLARLKIMLALLGALRIFLT